MNCRKKELNIHNATGNTELPETEATERRWWWQVDKERLQIASFAIACSNRSNSESMINRWEPQNEQARKALPIVGRGGADSAIPIVARTCSCFVRAWKGSAFNAAGERNHKSSANGRLSGIKRCLGIRCPNVIR